MALDFNSCFLDEKSDFYNYYVGIPNLDTPQNKNISDTLKECRKKSLSYLGICEFNFNLSKLNSNSHKNSLTLDLIKDTIYNLGKKYDYPCFFSCKISANPLGYLNFWNSNFIYKGSITSISDLLNWLNYDKTAFISVKTPHTGILSLPLNKTLLDKVLLLEISNNKTDLNFSSYENIYFNMLDKGWKLGVISNFNNEDLFNEKQWFTGIISKAHYSNLLVDSLRERLSYSTKSKSLKLFFSINFVSIGDTLKAEMDDLLSFYIYIEDYAYNITQVDILSNDGEIIKSLNTVPLKRIKYIFKENLKDSENWFLLRIFSNNTLLAISSPIFIEKSRA